MELKTVATRHVPVRYLEGGSGPDLSICTVRAGSRRRTRSSPNWPNPTTSMRR